MICRRVVVGIVVCMLIVGLEGLFHSSRADDAVKEWVSRIISLQGHVLARRRGATDWKPVVLDDPLFPGDQIRVEANSRVGIVLNNNSVLRLDQNTTLVFTEIETPSTFIFRLLKGAVNFFSHRPHSLKFRTPFVNGVVEGTEFFVRVDDRQTQIDLFEGRIRAENDKGVLQLAKGQRAVATTGQAPRSEIMVHPRNSVQWALHYPPILALVSGQEPDYLRASLAHYNQGRTADALESMAAVAQDDRNARYYTFRAALLLNVGRVALARDDIQRALDIDNGNSEALALKAVIAVVQNQKGEALDSALQAVRSNARSSAAHIALSYAHQAVFDLPAALRDAQAAADNEPEGYIAWARLAEVQLSNGRLDQGIQAAQKAAALNPRFANTYAILGFAYLMQIKTDKSQEAFNQAIHLDSTAPLPRLGLGLAKIREGELQQGREQLEIAAGLDPANALVRSYLGKAYFDENRGPLDEREFEIAKSLDPGDPTPWFYGAIRKQTLNRPVEALKDLQRSIELNDNRAVYRSRLMLDEDLAARSASVGRIFSDLEFGEIALRKGWDSLNIAPSNYSAHRLLADTYATRPRHQIARVSELLQSQLYQPLNLTPIQPQLAESTLKIPQGVGISDTSFNEFNPLYSRNRTALLLDAVAGEQQTRGEDITLAGLQQWFSYSLGQYHFETDGFRENNDLNQDIRDVFMQARIADNASIQFEYRSNDKENGDLIQEFDPDEFSANQRESRKESIPRLGLHYMPSDNQHLILSLLFNNTDYRLRYNNLVSTPFGSYTESYDRRDDIEAYNMEGQYLLQSTRFNIVTGGGHYQQDSETEVADILTFAGVDYPEITSNDNEIRHSNAYLYSTISATSTLKATLGASWDGFKLKAIETDQFNPKIGLSWQVVPQTTIRACAFRTLKRSLVANQTIEPTQVAGFNQFFDDPTAADARRYGIGIDHRISPDLFTGADATYGDLIFPIQNTTTGYVREEHKNETLYRFYLYWMATYQLAVSTDFRYEYYTQDFKNQTNLPKKLHTYYLPVSVVYFHPSGFYAKMQGQYVNQEIEQYKAGATIAETGKDDFFVFDASVGYRFLNRYGIISLSATNLFDTEFKFFDGNYALHTAESPYIRPERQLLLKFTLSL